MPTLVRSGTPAARTLGLARANAVLLLRNRLTLINALVVPLMPALWGLGAPSKEAAAEMVVPGVLMLAVLFPVFYNVLSLTVTRRDELVLKRLRTGEVTDRELLASLALPGCVVAMVVAALLVVVAALLGLPLPVNPLLYALTVMACAAVLAGLAFWTASWTRNAEAAQLSSLPVILLVVGGTRAPALPERFDRIVAFTPGAALTDLARISWFGQGPDGDLTFLTAWGAAALPLGVLVAWLVLSLWLVRRSFAWEPRT